MDDFNIWGFCLTIVNTCIAGVQSLYNILTTDIQIFGLFEWIGNVIEFFGGDAPQWLYDVAQYNVNLLTLGGVLLGAFLLIVIVKKVVPLF